MSHPTIADIVKTSDGVFDGEGDDFDILRRALEAADLIDVVADPHADFTVFAPTDDAFVELARSLGADVEDGDDEAAFNAIVEALTALSPDGDPIPLLKDVLLYHVAPGARDVAHLQEDGTIETALGVTFDVNGTELNDQDPDIENPEFVEGLTDIQASNGIVQVIDRVLLPIDLPGGEPEPTIADVVLQSGGTFDGDGGDFDILLQALQAADLVDVVADPEADFTVFAPTDDAFIQLARDLGADIEDGDDAGAFEAIVQALTELSPDGDPIPLLRDVLLYHVSPGGRTVEDLQADGTVETALGVDIHVSGTELGDQDPDIENPEFIEGLTDIETSNGTIQSIDRVLLPIDVPGADDEATSDVSMTADDSFDLSSMPPMDDPVPMDERSYDDACMS
ncbi:MAG: fasciclin domain-containing protein [Pseudomonadota bacterium]